MDIVTRVEKVRETLMSCTERIEEERRNGRMLWMMTMQHEQCNGPRMQHETEKCVCMCGMCACGTDERENAMDDLRGTAERSVVENIVTTSTRTRGGGG